MSRNGQAVNWKKLDLELRDLIKNGRIVAYDIATRCRRVMDHPQDFAAATGIKEEGVSDYLQDNYCVGDWAIDLTSLLLVLKHRPHREQWNKSLFALCQEVETEIAAARKTDREAETGGESPVRKRPTFHQIQELEGRVKDAEYQRQMSEQIASETVTGLREKLARLEAEKAELAQQVANLQGQMEQLKEQNQALLSRLRPASI